MIQKPGIPLEKMRTRSIPRKLHSPQREQQKLLNELTKLPPIVSSSRNNKGVRVLDPNTDRFLNRLFINDELLDVDEWETSNPELDRSLSHEEEEEEETEVTEATSPTGVVAENEKTKTIEISNMSVSLDGYEGLKVCSFVDSSASSRYIFFDLDKKIRNAMATPNNSARLAKILMLKHLFRLSVKLIGKRYLGI